jgi:uncharacterized protein YdaU (DUF1376 family)
MNYYERHLGDYAKDTGHLSMLEHGAYNLLLDRYYGTETGIPTDQVYRIARARTDDERAAVDVVLKEFFDLKDGVWTKNRCDEEIVRAHIKIEAARENGKLGGRPRKNPEVTQEKPTGLLLGTPAGTQPLTQTKALQSPVSSLQSEESKSRSAAPDAPDPRKRIFELGVSLLGEKKRSLIGRAISQHGERRVGEVLGGMAAKPPVDPVPYFVAAIAGIRAPDEAAQRQQIP